VACDNGGSSYSNNGSSEKYDYCLLAEQKECLVGPFELSTCSGQLSNSCPAGYYTGSQAEKPSSSSNKVGNSSSSINNGNSSSSIVNSNVGKGNNISNYKTVKIGTQTWMAENLNYAIAGSKCYGEGGIVFNSAEVQDNCDTYGRLYDWATAMNLSSTYNTTRYSTTNPVKHKGICPVGWHIPNADEWNTLSSYIASDKGCSSCDAKHLKATTGWNNGGNGLDTYGFAALPGGGGDSGGLFDGAGDVGYWWSASENNAYGAYFRFMYYLHEYASWLNNNKSFLQSVRCLQD
jgi:uncharacterized protein (TIGR02145 family)